MANERRIQSITKAAAVLRALIDVDESIRLVDLAQIVGMNRSSLHVMLATLVDEDLVDQTGPGMYRLGLGTFELGAAALRQAGLSSRIAPPMEALARETGEAVSLSVIHDHSALLVSRYESSQVLRATIRAGTRMPLTTSASGRCIIAHVPAEEREQLVPSTERHLASAEDLARRLDLIRRRGYDTQRDEWAVGVSSTAVPIFDRGRRPIAALSVSMPSTRYSEESWIDELSAAARALEDVLSSLPRSALADML